MGDAGDRVLVDAEPGCEEPRHEVHGGVGARCGDRDPHHAAGKRNPGQGAEIGPCGEDVILRRKRHQRHLPRGGEDGGGRVDAQSLGEPRGHRPLHRRIRREVQPQTAVLVVDAERPGSRLETHRPRDLHLAQEHVGAGQGGVATERHFRNGSEPAQAADTPLAGRVDERGFGQVHLRRDPRHGRIGQIVDLQTDGGRVAAERGIGERVHRVEWNPSTGHFSLGLDGVVCKGRKAGDIW